MDMTLSRKPIGQLLDGRYRVESLIAHGGMATVYLGTDTRLDRTVALKIMHAQFATDEDFVRRFVAEARSVARLSHPNVVTVFDQGADGPALYLAMEHVPGRTLRDLLRQQGRLHPDEALEIMQGVLAGLGAAHAAGIAHRDVKPENVLITPSRTVKVADFGLARVFSTPSHTRSGVIIGTAAYLAPEQVAGDRADARTDVYAAGIMLFEMLTGTQPFTAETPLAVAYQHVNEAVPAPSSWVPGVPPVLDSLVTFATSKDPDLRPADAGEFLRAVNGIRQGMADGTVPVGPPPGWFTGTASDQAPPTAFDPSRGSPAGPPPGQTTDFIPGMPPPARQSYGGSGEASSPFRQGPYHKTLIVTTGDDESGPFAPPRHYSGPEEPRLQRLLFSRRLIYLATAIAVVVVIGAVAWWQSAGRYTTVPPVSGMVAATAQLELKNSGFQVVTPAARLNNQFVKGEVIATVPAAGARVPKGDRVTVLVSAGPHMLSVPQVTGQALAAAQGALRKAGLVPGKVARVTSATVPAGIVISTSPSAGATWPQPQPVSLTVSAGPPLPNFVGQQKTAAEGWASQYGATLNEVTSTKGGQPAGTVISQSPAAGSAYTRGEVVTITISPGPPMVPIPNVDGQNAKTATASLKQLGFKVHIVQAGPFQTVFSYSPSGQAPQGSTITLYIGLPSVGGQSNGNSTASTKPGG